MPPVAIQQPTKHIDPEPLSPPRARAKPGYEVGDAYLDHGAVCERADRQGACFLDPAQRSRIIGELQHDFAVAEQHYGTALEHARIEALLTKAAGWGFVGEALFTLASTALLASTGLLATVAGTAAVARFLETETQALELRAAVDGIGFMGAKELATEELVGPRVQLVESIVRTTSSALKTPLKGAFDHYPAVAERKGQFVTELIAKASPFWEGTRRTLENTGDDIALVVALMTFSPEVLTIAMFEQQIAALIERFESSHLPEIGVVREGPAVAGTLELVLVEAWGRSRLALVRFGERNRMGRSHGDDWVTDGMSHFVSWVDDEFVDAAQAAQAAHVGPIKRLDVHKGHHLQDAGELDAWIAVARPRAKRSKP